MVVWAPGGSGSRVRGGRRLPAQPEAVVGSRGRRLDSAFANRSHRKCAVQRSYRYEGVVRDSDEQLCDGFRELADASEAGRPQNKTGYWTANRATALGRGSVTRSAGLAS